MLKNKLIVFLNKFSRVIKSRMRCVREVACRIGIGAAVECIITPFNGDVLRHYYRKISSYIYDNYVENNVDLNLLEVDLTKNSGPIWIMWWESDTKYMPVEVSACIASVLRNAGEHKVVIINKDNFKEYVDIPPYILSLLAEGKISLAAFSDYMRFKLLYKFGGLWIDATVFLSDEIPSDIWEYSFYSRRRSTQNDDFWIWSIFYIGGCRLNPLFHYITDIYDEYWKKNNDLLDYLMTDCIIQSLYANIPQIKKMIQQVPVNNSGTFILEQHFNEDCRMLKTVPHDVYMHKTTYKRVYRNYTRQGKTTIYKHFIDGTLQNEMHKMQEDE